MVERPLVAVFLGTDHHQFDRLVMWVRDVVAEAQSWRWFVQHGYTKLPPGVEGRQMLTLGRLNECMAEASAVVTHGGPGLIMEARAAGHVPVVVPRKPALGEHVDGHQERFCARAADSGLITLAESREQLLVAVRAAIEVGRQRSHGGEGNAETVRRFSDLVDALVRG